MTFEQEVADALGEIVIPRPPYPDMRLSAPAVLALAPRVAAAIQAGVEAGASVVSQEFNGGAAWIFTHRAETEALAALRGDA